MCPPDLGETSTRVGPEGQVFGVGNLRELALRQHLVGKRPDDAESALLIEREAALRALHVPRGVDLRRRLPEVDPMKMAASDPGGRTLK